MVISFVLRGQNTLVVTVEGTRGKNGSVMVGLFTDRKKFLKKATYGKVIPASVHATRVVFENLEPGEYGISVIHDMNSNGKLDTNILGIPKEGFGFGNNAMGVFGPPTFENAKILIGMGEHQHVIRMKYF